MRRGREGEGGEDEKDTALHKAFSPLAVGWIRKCWASLNMLHTGTERKSEREQMKKNIRGNRGAGFFFWHCCLKDTSKRQRYCCHSSPVFHIPTSSCEPCFTSPCSQLCAEECSVDHSGSIIGSWYIMCVRWRCYLAEIVKFDPGSVILSWTNSRSLSLVLQKRARAPTPPPQAPTHRGLYINSIFSQYAALSWSLASKRVLIFYLTYKVQTEFTQNTSSLGAHSTQWRRRLFSGNNKQPVSKWVPAHRQTAIVLSTLLPQYKRWALIWTLCKETGESTEDRDL